MIVALVGARLRSAALRWTPTIVALGLGFGVPVGSHAAALVTADATLRRSLAELPAADRMVTVATFRQPGEELPEGLDDRARDGIAALGDTEPVRVLAYRPLSDTAGGTFQLAAADSLGRWARLTDGRMPERCDPDYCEVVQLADRRPAGPLPPSLGIVVVGTAVRTDPLLLAGTYEADPDSSVLIADGVDRLDRLRALELFGRSHGWLADVDLDHVRAVGVDAWGAAAVSTADRVSTLPWNLGLSAPDRVLAAEVARARRSADRFLLLGSAMGVLLLGASVVAGTAMRRDHEAFVAALRRRGMATRRIAAVSLGETSGVVAAGGGLGIVLGGGAASLLATGDGLRASSLAPQAIVASLPTIGAFAAASIGLIMITLVMPAHAAGRRDAWRLVDAGMVLAGAALALIATRDDAAGADRSQSTLALLPALALALGGLATARLWPFAADRLRRSSPRQAVALRLGVSGAAGRPLRPIALAALLAASVGAVVFAVSYRQTLHRGVADQAAEAVPLDARITTGAALERPLDLLMPGSEALPPDAGSWPVLRAAASVRVGSTQGQTVQLVGVEPEMLESIRRWPATVGTPGGGGLAGALDVGDLDAGVRVPAGRRFVIDVTGPRVSLALTATLRTDDGRVRSVPLQIEPEGGQDGSQQLVGELPELAGVSDLDLVALTAAEPSDATTRRQHNLGEGRSDRSSPTATIVLGAVTVDGRDVGDVWTGWNSLVAERDLHRWDIVLAASRSSIASRPDGPGSIADPLPVAVDSVTAASVGGRGGQLTLVLNRVAVTATVVEVLPRFPTVRGRFAIVDRVALERLVDVTEPGTGQPGELWVDLRSQVRDDDVRRLDDPLLQRLTVTYRDDVASHLGSDPVAVSASRILLSVALAMMLLAIATLVLFAVTERYDDATEALAWEAEGVPPSTLRASLIWRVAAIAGPAVPLGVAAGVLLSRLTARMIAVTAGATVAIPPLVPGTGTWWGVTAAIAGTLVGLCAIGLVATRSWRERLPRHRTGGVA